MLKYIMILKNIHPARRALRIALLVCLLTSFTFFAFIVFLRVYYKDRDMSQYVQTRIFEADIIQHQVAAYFSDDEEDMEIAERLLKQGFFSRAYLNAGIEMIEQKAKTGYQPAIDRLAKLENLK